MAFATQQDQKGATQGVTQDASQYVEEAPEATTSPAPVEPGDPKDPGGAGDPVQPPHPQVVPSSTPEGPSTIPAPTTPEGEPGPDAQLRNAATSLEEPSDNSAGEGASR